MKEKHTTGWEKEKREHFNDITENYDKIRPNYPKELFSDILDYSKTNGNLQPLAGGKEALEIGAGTGKATTPFLEAGYNVTAVEISYNMADFLQNKFMNYKGFRTIVSSFEDAELENEKYDLIYAASAFHWVDPNIGCPKAFNLLKEGGVFALFRYNFIPADGDELYEEIQNLYEKFYRLHYKSSTRPVKDEYGSPSQILHRFGFHDLAEFGFTGITTNLYEKSWLLDADEYIMLLNTLSDHRHLPDENRTALYEGIRKAIIKHGGKIKESNTFQLYMGRK